MTRDKTAPATAAAPETETETDAVPRPRPTAWLSGRVTLALPRWALIAGGVGLGALVLLALD